MKKILSIWLCALAVGWLLPVARTAELAEKLQKGLFEEEANHNLEAAIAQYKLVITAADDQRKITATAIYRLAECYRKLGKQKEADELYSRLQRDFSDQSQLLAARVSPNPTTSQKPTSLSDFLGSERMAAIQPDLISCTVRQGQMEEVLRAVKNLDPERLSVILPIAYRSSGYRPTDPLGIFSDKQRLAELKLSQSETTPVDIEELTRRIAAAEERRKADIKFALQQLGFSVSNNIVKCEKLESERKQIFATISRDAAIPLLQKFMRDLLAEKENKAKEIEALQRDIFQGLGNFFNSADPIHNRISSELLMLNPENFAKQPDAADTKNVEKKKARLNEELKAREEMIREGLDIKVASLSAAIGAIDALIKSAETDYKRATGETQTPASAQSDSNPYASLIRLLDNSPDLLNAPNTTNNLSYIQQAAMTGDVELLELLLQRGAVVDKPNYDGMTPLHMTVWKGHKKAAELLIKAGANVNAQTRSSGSQNTQVPEGSSPLHTAASYGFTALSELLLDNGAAINATDKGGKTPLHRAAENGQLQEIQLLLRKGADIEAKPESGSTPLLTATAYKQSAAALLLVSSNAQVNVTDKLGNTVVTFAANGLRELIPVFVQKGADPNARNREGETALMLALQQGDYLTCEQLLREKADPNLVDGEGRSATHLAVLKPDIRILELLLDSGADPDMKDNRQLTALDYAVGGARIGARIESRRFSGVPTTTGPQPQAVQLLLSHGAKAESQAVWRTLDAPDVLKLLLEAKADPNIKDRDRTPLDYLKNPGPSGLGPERERSLHLLEKYGGTNTDAAQATFQQRLQQTVNAIPQTNGAFRQRLNQIVPRSNPQTNGQAQGKSEEL